VLQAENTTVDLGPMDDCPNKYEHGKFMMTLGNLLEEKWEVRRFHL
jgi:hypothetical protein